MASSSKPPPPGASKPTPSSSASTPPSTATMSSPAAPVYQFSSDTERLKNVLSVSKSPVEEQIKRVLDLLYEIRKGLRPEQIKELCNVDVNGNEDVFQSLKNDPKVHYDGSCFSYKPKHVQEFSESRYA